MSTPNIAEIHYRDLINAPRPAPGQFGLEVFFNADTKLHSKEQMVQWLQKLFQDGGLPGAHLLYPCPENNPPFLVMQIVDYSAPETMTNMANITDPNILESHEQHAIDQADLKRQLSAPSITAAVMSKFLGYAIAAKEMDPQSASLVLMQHLKIPEMAAKGLVQRGTELVRSELGIQA